MSFTYSQLPVYTMERTDTMADSSSSELMIVITSARSCPRLYDLYSERIKKKTIIRSSCTRPQPIIKMARNTSLPVGFFVDALSGATVRNHIQIESIMRQRSQGRIFFMV